MRCTEERGNAASAPALRAPCSAGEAMKDPTLGEQMSLAGCLRVRNRRRPEREDEWHWEPLWVSLRNWLYRSQLKDDLGVR